MSKNAVHLYTTLLICAGIAHASGRPDNWKHVKVLAQGVQIEVESQNRPGTEPCRVLEVDDTALTCERGEDPNVDWGSGTGAGVIFPRDVIRTISVWEDVSDRRVWAKVGAGFVIGGLLCSAKGAIALACAGVGGILGAFASAPQHPGYQPKPDWRLKLWYRAPQTAPSP